MDPPAGFIVKLREDDLKPSGTLEECVYFPLHLRDLPLELSRSLDEFWFGDLDCCRCHNKHLHNITLQSTINLIPRNPRFNHLRIDRMTGGRVISY